MQEAAGVPRHSSEQLTQVSLNKAKQALIIRDVGSTEPADPAASPEELYSVPGIGKISPRRATATSLFMQV